MLRMKPFMLDWMADVARARPRRSASGCSRFRITL